MRRDERKSRRKARGRNRTYRHRAPRFTHPANAAGSRCRAHGRVGFPQGMGAGPHSLPRRHGPGSANTPGQPCTWLAACFLQVTTGPFNCFPALAVNNVPDSMASDGRVIPKAARDVPGRAVGKRVTYGSTLGSCRYSPPPVRKGISTFLLQLGGHRNPGQRGAPITRSKQGRAMVTTVHHVLPSRPSPGAARIVKPTQSDTAPCG